MRSDRDMDALLVDWLYGELSGEDQSRFEAYLEGSAEARAQAEAMQRTRDAFRGLADAQEEPPAAVSAILLHEAAVRARKRPEPEGQGGFVAWLGSLVRPFALHPAATAIATLVLVAGVAGTLFVRNADQAPLPARSAAPAPTDRAPAAAATAAPAEEAADEAAPQRPEPGYLADLADSKTEADLDRAAKDDGLDALAADAPAEAKKKERKGSVTGRVAARDQARRRAAEKETPGKLAEGAAANAVSSADPPPHAEAEISTQAKQVATPEAEFAQPPSGDTSLGYRGDDADAEERSASERVWTRQQSVALDRAVDAKKCREAADIANDIRDRNPEYFRREVEGSKKVAPCQWYVTDERQRRLARRKAARQRQEAAESDKRGSADEAQASSPSKKP